jgi:hypothetical protein
MSDPWDEWLARLPIEPPAPDLSARIVSVVAQRRRARTMWRHLGAAALACALAGVMLVLVSWPQVVASLTPAVNSFETNYLAPAFNALLTTPGETLIAWLDAGLAWQAAQAEGIGVAFMLGVALLAVAAFGGLAQMLHARAPNRYSH